MQQDTRAILSAFREILGDKHVITDREEILRASLDGRGRRQGDALALVRPANTGETAAVMRTARQFNLIVIVQGGNTSNMGGATPEPGQPEETVRRTIILQTTRMNRILSVDPVNNTVTVEAGVILQKVQEAARQVNRLFPLSLAAEGSAVIGGIIATNAGGVHVLRYGMARRMVLGLTVVLASGETLNLMRALRKDNAGYALKELFIGSEGTLGIVTQAVLSLEPLPCEITSAWVTLSDITAVETLFGRLEEAFGPSLTAFELIGREPLRSLESVTGMTPPVPVADWQVLLDLSVWQKSDMTQERLEALLETLMEAGYLTNGTVSQSNADREDFWRCRESIPSAVKRQGGNVKHDISVPRSALPRFIIETVGALQSAFPGVHPSIFGHYGDGNLHFNVGPGPVAFPHEEKIHRLVHQKVIDFEGSIAAEHGIGSLKTDELRLAKTPEEIAAMRSLKYAFDPDNRLNPGRIVRL